MHAIDVTDEEWRGLGRLSDAFRRKYGGPTRAEAIAQGLAWYFTGVPCRLGHATWKRVSNRRCEACEKIEVSAWRAANPEKVKAANQIYRERHPERAKEQHRRTQNKLRQKNPEKFRLTLKAYWIKNGAKYRETMRLYRKNNPEIVRAANAEYRARKRNAAGELTAADFAEILQRQRFRCHWCDASIRTGSQIDHVVPLVRGGEHSAANVVGACGSCNRRKRSKDPIAWANELGRLF